MSTLTRATAIAAARAPPARARATEYLAAWHDRAWDRMALWSTADAAALRGTHAVDRLRGWALTAANAEAGSATIEVRTARRGMRPTVRREPLTLTLRRIGGRWLVDPSAQG